MVDPWTFIELGLGAGMKAWDVYDAKKMKKKSSQGEGSKEAGPSSSARDGGNVAAAASRAEGSGIGPAEGSDNGSTEAQPGLAAGILNKLESQLGGRKGKGSSSGPNKKWQEEFNKINEERRTREEEARKKWEEGVGKLMREERDERKRREEVSKADAERAKQEREARDKWEEEMSKLRAEGKC